jgi:AraC-like DNA-binding protein
MLDAPYAMPIPSCQPAAAGGSLDSMESQANKTSTDTGENGRERTLRAAHPRLRPFLASGYEGFAMGWSAPPMLEVPFAGVPFVISFGDGYNVIDSNGRNEQRHTFVAGIADTWAVVESGRQSSGIQVNFTPIGARMFLGVSMNSITNRTVELEDVFGHSARHLVEQLQSAPSWDARFDLLDRVICARLDAAAAPPPPVLWAWNKLKASGGNASIGAIAGELGYSHKHLINRFRDEIGLPPKTLARVLRFSRAVSIVREGGDVDWLDVAESCGYFDQAHLIRDFREFAGLTPSEFLARRLEFGGIALDPLDSAER